MSSPWLSEANHLVDRRRLSAFPCSTAFHYHKSTGTPHSRHIRPGTHQAYHSYRRIRNIQCRLWYPFISTRPFQSDRRGSQRGPPAKLARRSRHRQLGQEGVRPIHIFCSCAWFCRCRTWIPGWAPARCTATSHGCSGMLLSYRPVIHTNPADQSKPWYFSWDFLTPACSSLPAATRSIRWVAWSSQREGQNGAQTTTLHHQSTSSNWRSTWAAEVWTACRIRPDARAAFASSVISRFFVGRKSLSFEIPCQPKGCTCHSCQVRLQPHAEVDQ